MPSPPPRRESFHFPPTGTNPPSYSSLSTLADALRPGALALSQNDKAVLKESLTISSTSSYSYSETSTTTSTSVSPPVLQVYQSTVSNDISNSNVTATTNAQVQERKVSSLKLTPVTIPDPPAHINYDLEPQPQPKTQTSASPPPPTPPPRLDSTISRPPMQTASLSVRLAPKTLTHPELQSPNTMKELKVQAQAPIVAPTPASSPMEVTMAPAVPPRPSPAELLVHN